MKFNTKPVLKKAPLLAVIAGGLLLSGCGSLGLSGPKYECPVDESGLKSCRSAQEAYRAAVAGGGTEDSVFTPEPEGKEKHKTVAAPGERVFGGYPADSERGKPVYTLPSVHRLWIAPYGDPQTGILHGGELVYYTTPGYWNYGEMTAPGEGAELLGPIKPSDLGFRPLLDPLTDTGENAAPKPRKQNGIVQPYRQVIPHSAVESYRK